MYNKEAMIELKKLLFKQFPDLIDKIILYGSRAEDKEKEYSDYDILLILKRNYDWKLKQKIRDSMFDFIIDYDIVTDTKLISNSELGTIKGRLPFVEDALTKGIVL